MATVSRQLSRRPLIQQIRSLQSSSLRSHGSGQTSGSTARGEGSLSRGEGLLLQGAAPQGGEQLGAVGITKLGLTDANHHHHHHHQRQQQQLQQQHRHQTSSSNHDKPAASCLSVLPPTAPSAAPSVLVSTSGTAGTAATSPAMARASPSLTSAAAAARVPPRLLATLTPMPPFSPRALLQLHQSRPMMTNLAASSSNSAAASPGSSFSSPSQDPTKSRLAAVAAGTAIALAGQICLYATVAASSVSAKEKPRRELPGEVVLYQYEACPFCNKVKAFLDYHDIPYRVVEVNPIGKKELAWSEYKKVPVVVVDGTPYVDSSAIITSLDEQLNPGRRPASKDGSNSEDEETKWRKWVDNHLVHLLSPNIYRTPSEALEAFDYIATNGNFSAYERVMARYVGAGTMYLIGKKLKKKHNIDDERKSIYDAAEEWVAALDGRDFLGGGKPNLADLAVFGVLRPIRHMTTGKDLMENTRIGEWYERMEQEVGESSRIKASN